LRSTEVLLDGSPPPLVNFFKEIAQHDPCHASLSPLVDTPGCHFDRRAGKGGKSYQAGHCPGPFEPVSGDPANRQCSLTTESQWPHPTAALLRCRDQPLRGVTGCTGAPCPYRPHPAPLPSRERERERPFTSRSSSAGAYNGRGYKRHGSRVICFLAGGTFDDRRRDRGAADRSVHRPGRTCETIAFFPSPSLPRSVCIRGRTPGSRPFIPYSKSWIPAFAGMTAPPTPP